MKIVKPKNWLESVNCAIEGILWSARTQKHMRYHFLAAIAVLLLALMLRLTAIEFILLTLSIALVLFAEMINTALETIVDLVSPDYHPLAKRAKDVASGAVLVTAIGAALVGYLVFSRSILPMLDAGMALAHRPVGEMSLVAVLVVTIMVVLLKARSATGSPLHGGMPSGHAAVSFSIATSVVLSQVGPVVAVLTVVLATMVSHSRLLMGIHTFREVCVGALLGVMVTGTIYLIFT